MRHSRQGRATATFEYHGREETVMPIASKATIARALLCTVVIAAAACSPRKIPPMTVADFMDDRVKLDGMILKCNQDPVRARGDSDCMNARIAVDRLESESEALRQAKSAEDFERNREQLRSMQDKQRQQQEAKDKVDAYHLPLVPIEPSPPPKDPQSPIVGQTSR
jgi:hypothetical protein